MPEQFDIYSKNFCRDVENFFRYLCVLVLRHQMPVSNYFVNSFYSVEVEGTTFPLAGSLKIIDLSGKVE